MSDLTEAYDQITGKKRNPGVTVYRPYSPMPDDRCSKCGQLAGAEKDSWLLLIELDGSKTKCHCFCPDEVRRYARLE